MENNMIIIKRNIDRLLRYYLEVVQVKDLFTDEWKTVKSIRGCLLSTLKVAGMEMEMVINYLTEQDILIRGIMDFTDPDCWYSQEKELSFDFDSLPKALSKDENSELLEQMDAIRCDLESNIDELENVRLKKELENIRLRLIEGNMRLVSYLVTIATPLMLNDYDKEDLLQFGYEILIESVDRYRLGKGYALSTAICNYIVMRVWLKYYDTRMIRIPSTKRIDMNSVIRAKRMEEVVLNRELSEEEAALRLGMSREGVKKALELYAIHEPVYFEDKEMRYEELVAEGLSLEEMVERDDLKVVLKDVLDTLRPIEAAILRYRYGFDDGNLHTFDECSHEFMKSRTRIIKLRKKH